MDAMKKGWFSELSTLWPGQCMSLEIKEVLYDKKSKYQHVIVADTTHYGKVLILDGIIQCTERDEFSYQEMITHLPINCHPNPQDVLVIGGGDGGAVRELDKHPAVKNITMCEIDKDVIETSKKFLPNMSCGFNSKKLNLHIGDGFKFMEANEGKFDVIITDSSDPIGPASSLFEKSYYELMKKALKPGGIVCSQGECIWLHLDIIKDMQDFCKELYPVVDYGYCTIPTYPSGQIGFTLCSLNPETNFKEPLRIINPEEQEQLKLRYYSPEIHRASFVLPRFVKKKLESADK